MPISTSGAIAAVDSAAIDHQSIPCDPVWLATMTGSVLGSVLVNKAAKKYSFQQSTTERMKAATIPGNAIGSTMRVNATQIEAPSTCAACSSSRGMALNWSRMIQMTIGSTISV